MDPAIGRSGTAQETEPCRSVTEYSAPWWQSDTEDLRKRVRNEDRKKNRGTAVSVCGGSSHLFYMAHEAEERRKGVGKKIPLPSK